MMINMFKMLYEKIMMHKGSVVLNDYTKIINLNNDLSVMTYRYFDEDDRCTIHQLKMRCEGTWTDISVYYSADELKQIYNKITEIYVEHVQNRERDDVIAKLVKYL